MDAYVHDLLRRYSAVARRQDLNACGTHGRTIQENPDNDQLLLINPCNDWLIDKVKWAKSVGSVA